jgi:hypothetical protein
MSGQSDSLDFGLRSNDSQFSTLDIPREELDSKSKSPLSGARAPAAGERLAFRVSVVQSEADLDRVQELRQAAYGHHLPALAASFGQPDPVDRWPDVTIFFAEDKATRRVVGSARLQCNRGQPLQIERSIALPPRLAGKLLAEVTRMSVIPGYAHPVKLALVKAIHLYCIAMQIGGIVCASRPSLMRQYLNLGFEDLYGDDRLAPMAHGGGIEHRVLFRDTVTSEAYNRDRQHPDYSFVFRTYHPDIEVFDAVVQVPEPLRQTPAERRYNRAA